MARSPSPVASNAPTLILAAPPTRKRSMITVLAAALLAGVAGDGEDEGWAHRARPRMRSARR